MNTDDDSTEPTGPQPHPQPDPHPHPRSRDYTHIYGTRIRTTTAAMLVAFFGLLMLLGYTTDHYAQIDAENAARELARRPALTQTTDDYTPTSTTSTTESSKRRSSSTEVTTTPSDGDSETGSSSTAPSASNSQLPLPSWLFPQGTTSSNRQLAPESQVPQR